MINFDQGVLWMLGYLFYPKMKKMIRILVVGSFFLKKKRKKRNWHTRGQNNQVFVIVHLVSCVCLLVTPRPAACQASLSFTVTQSLPKCMSIESVMLFSPLILCHLFLLLPSILSRIKVLGFPAGSDGKESACNVGDQGWIGKISWRRGWPHSSILAWRILWTEEPGELQSMGSQKVRHD